ncbi:hypothetical protein GC173_01115 [bacterium]|nr:hypothetical protein [bacterium]
MPSRYHLFFLLAAGLMALLGAGCAHQQRDNLRTVKVAVIDAPVFYEVAPKGEVVTKGWWLGAHDRFKSPNAGSLIAESLARELDRIPGVEVYSREDLTIYMSQKERLLRRRYPSLSSTQRKDILVRQDPLDYGRSLNVDFVVAPTVTESVTVVNRTFTWWYSHAEADVQIYDVSTGNVVWTMPWDKTSNFSSQLALFESYARRVSRGVTKVDAFRVERP